MEKIDSNTDEKIMKHKYIQPAMEVILCDELCDYNGYSVNGDSSISDDNKCPGSHGESNVSGEDEGEAKPYINWDDTLPEFNRWSTGI